MIKAQPMGRMKSLFTKKVQDFISHFLVPATLHLFNVFEAEDVEALGQDLGGDFAQRQAAVVDLDDVAALKKIKTFSLFK